MFNESKGIPCLLIVDQEQFINILVNIGKKYFTNVGKFRHNKVYLKKKIIKRTMSVCFKFMFDTDLIIFYIT